MPGLRAAPRSRRGAHLRDRAGRSRAGGRRPGVFGSAHARDHESRGRRGHRAPGGAGARASTWIGSSPRGRGACSPRPSRMVHNETSTGATYPAAEVGRMVKRARGALHARHRVVARRASTCAPTSGASTCNMTGSQKCLAAPLGMVAGERRVRAPGRPWSSASTRRTRCAYDLLRWKESWIPASRGGSMPDGAPRRQPVSIPTHLTEAPARGGAAHPRGGPRPPLPPSRGGRRARCAPASRPCGSEMFPDAVHRVQHRVVLSRRPSGIDAGRGGAGTCATATASSSAPARQDPHDAPCASGTMGITASLHVRAAHAVRARADAARLRATSSACRAPGVAAAQAAFSDGIRWPR